MEKEKAMTPDEAKLSVLTTPNWKLDKTGKLIYREYVMKDFMSAVDLIKRVAEVAEAANHHPNIHLTGYRRLRIELSTHEAGGLTEKDFDEAARINDLPAELKI
jgi:4a-hydroxytetrahydrobiopterin dehydratase